MKMRHLLSAFIISALGVSAFAENPATPVLKVNRLKSNAASGKIELDSGIFFKETDDRDAFVLHLGLGTPDNVLLANTTTTLTADTTIDLDGNTFFFEGGPVAMNGSMLVTEDGLSGGPLAINLAAGTGLPIGGIAGLGTNVDAALAAGAVGTGSIVRNGGDGDLNIVTTKTTQTAGSGPMSVIGNSLTTGSLLYLASSSLTTGRALDIAVTGSGAGTGYGAYIANTRSGSANVALRVAASNGSSNTALELVGHALFVSDNTDDIGSSTKAPRTGYFGTSVAIAENGGTENTITGSGSGGLAVARGGITGCWLYAGDGRFYAASGGSFGFTSSSSSAVGTADLVIYRDAAATGQWGADHATTPTAQTLKSHDVTTGTGASMTIAGGKGSVAGGEVILATSATNGAPVARLTVAASGASTFSGSVAIGSGAAIAKVLSSSGSVDFGSTADNGRATQTITVTGAATTNTPSVAIGGAPPTNWVITGAYVSAADTVTITAINKTGGTDDPGAVTLRATVTSF